MDQTAKLFNNGGSQAVRLPKAFRFDGDELLVKLEGDGDLDTKASQLG